MTTDVGEPIVLERRIDAPVATVFRYLTDGELWSRWQGATADLDAQPGGTFRMTMPTGQVAEGAFVEVEPDRRVVFTWGWSGHDLLPPGASTVEIELTPDGAGTFLRLTHRGVPRSELALHHAGWTHYLPRLVTAAEGGDPGPDTLPG